MKIYICADIEGITGVDHWDEATKSKPGYETGIRQMTAEVKAACEAAINSGASEILVQDAHDSARNLDMNALPEKVRILRGWSEEPRCMVQAIDKTYSALILIGHHSAAGSAGNPLSHTLSIDVTSIKINGRLATEYLILQHTAAYFGVPLIFLSGDKTLCNEVNEINPATKTVAVKEGVGNSVLNLHPQQSIKLIREGVSEALAKDMSDYRFSLPNSFHIEINYRFHARAHTRSFYPGIQRTGDTTLVYQSNDWYEVLRTLMFVVCR